MLLKAENEKKTTYYHHNQELKTPGVIHYGGFTGTSELIIKCGSPSYLLS